MVMEAVECESAAWQGTPVDSHVAAGGRTGAAAKGRTYVRPLHTHVAAKGWTGTAAKGRAHMRATNASANVTSADRHPVSGEDSRADCRHLSGRR